MIDYRAPVLGRKFHRLHPPTVNNLHQPKKIMEQSSGVHKFGVKLRAVCFPSSETVLFIYVIGLIGHVSSMIDDTLARAFYLVSDFFPKTCVGFYS